MCFLFLLLQALERGCVCEGKGLSGRGGKKYGFMLSRLFERSWEKNHLSNSNARDILNFTLSWKPFVQFLDMFCKSLIITCLFFDGSIMIWAFLFVNIHLTVFQLFRYIKRFGLIWIKRPSGIALVNRL